MRKDAESSFFPHLSSCPSRSYLQSEYLLIQQDILFLNNPVVVVVAEKPVSESALLCHLIQEIRQRICLIKSTAQFILYRDRVAVGDDVVYFSRLALAVWYSSSLGSSSFQQNHRGANPPDVSALPFLLRIFPQSIVVFVIPRYKGRSEGPTLQPVQALSIPLIAVPYTAEVSTNQHDVLFCEGLLFIEDIWLKAPEVSVNVSCYINLHDSVLLSVQTFIDL
jgi:hypothetical protein